MSFRLYSVCAFVIPLRTRHTAAHATADTYTNQDNDSYEHPVQYDHSKSKLHQLFVTTITRPTTTVHSLVVVTKYPNAPCNVHQQ